MQAQDYDEYLIAHKDRDLIPTATSVARRGAPPRDVFPHHVIGNGRLAGSWRRLEKGAVRAEIDLYFGVASAATRLVAAAAARYEAFVTGGWDRGLS